MTLITTGKNFIHNLKKFGSLGVYAPLEGGYEGRYCRRLRSAGYHTISLTAKGLGDIAAYLTGVHGVRPPHLGKKSTINGASVGYLYYIPPIVTSQLEQLPPKSNGLVLWIIEGHVLDDQEIDYLVNLPNSEPRVRVVVERGGDRVFRWEPLELTMAVPS